MKLIRDRLAESPGKVVVAQAPEADHRKLLFAKLIEECLEVQSADTTQERMWELADVFEVLRALARLDGCSMSEIYIMADEKRAARGGFDGGFDGGFVLFVEKA